MNETITIECEVCKYIFEIPEPKTDRDRLFGCPKCRTMLVLEKDLESTPKYQGS